jgi:hypothetical protein
VDEPRGLMIDGGRFEISDLKLKSKSAIDNQQSTIDYGLG